MVAKRAKASCTYQESSDDYVEKFGSTQGSGAPRILLSTVSPRPTKRAAAASYARRQRYKYRDDSDADDVD